VFSRILLCCLLYSSFRIPQRHQRQYKCRHRVYYLSTVTSQRTNGIQNASRCCLWKELFQQVVQQQTRWGRSTSCKVRLTANQTKKIFERRPLIFVSSLSLLQNVSGDFFRFTLFWRKVCYLFINEVVNTGTVTLHRMHCNNTTRFDKYTTKFCISLRVTNFQTPTKQYFPRVTQHHISAHRLRIATDFCFFSRNQEKNPIFGSPVNKNDVFINDLITYCSLLPQLIYQKRSNKEFFCDRHLKGNVRSGIDKIFLLRFKLQNFEVKRKFTNTMHSVGKSYSFA